MTDARISALAEDALFAISDLLDEDSSVYDLSPKEQIEWRYLHADCDDFALAMHMMLGWEIVGVSDSKGMPIHRLVSSPDGRMLDASGWTDEDALCRRYRKKKIRIERGIGSMSCISDDEDLIPVIEAATFLDASPFTDPDFRSRLRGFIDELGAAAGAEREERKYVLSDAQVTAEENRYTFFKPNQETCSKIQVDEFVKLVFMQEGRSSERMWVKVTELPGDDGLFTGILNNDPMGLDNVRCDDTIRFTWRHIISCEHDETQDSALQDKCFFRCYVSDGFFNSGSEILQATRVQPEDETDSGWRFHADESAPNKVSLGAVFRKNDSFLPHIDEPIGTSFVFSEGKWVKESSPRARNTP